MPRPVDGSTCALLSCKRVITESDPGVIVRRDNHVKRKKSKSDVVDWSDELTTFHWACWDSFIAMIPNSLSKRDILLRRGAKKSAEYYDSLEEIGEMAQGVARLIHDSQHLSTLSGAGISAAAGIPTYRGITGIDLKQEMAARDTDDDETDYTALKPTFTHLFLAELANDHGLLKYVVTQNCDGLERKAGISSQILSELHGNVFVESCEKCGKEYLRDFAVDAYSTVCYEEAWFVKCPRCGLGHYTGFICDDCGGKLKDTIINFGDYLHDSVCGGLDRAREHVEKCDVMLCLGTSLTVPPASTLCESPQSLIIINLQPTGYDDASNVAFRVWGTSDDFLKMVKEELVGLSGSKRKKRKKKGV